MNQQDEDDDPRPDETNGPRDWWPIDDPRQDETVNPHTWWPIVACLFVAALILLLLYRTRTRKPAALAGG